ncbi:MAG: 2,3-bisphosphoglycerate-independent phosphoglycerate mutase [Dehalococcoidales bacterium]
MNNLTDSLKMIKEVAFPSPGKIVLMVIDGLGGLPDLETGKTELETASLPNLDNLAAEGASGLTDPVAPGITPGSSVGHLALFGYDPVRYNIGRGILEAVGIDLKLQPGDVAARGNFCTLDENGRITDRRAGRVSNQKSTELCRMLDGQSAGDVEIIVRPVREHRFVAIFRGPGLAPEVSDSDPQQLDVPPKSITALNPEAEVMAGVANRFLAQAKETLAAHHPANMALLRGFSRHPDFPSMNEIYKLKPAAIASYPMYRGLAKLVGMEVLPTGATIREEFDTLKQHYADYDFFFLHMKGTDSAGEDGDFKRKVAVLEQIDGFIPELKKLNPDVIVVAGDHSTPATLAAHSWHPVPVLLHSLWCRRDGVSSFSESACTAGGLGRFPATQIMPLAMANALKLTKFGA